MDNFLNRITMYRLVLYYLVLLLGIAAILGSLGILPFGPAALLFSAAVLVFVSWTANELFARVFGAQPNTESVYITAFILALIIDPVAPSDMRGIGFLIWAAVWAMASKYIFALDRKHLFNPAAFAVALTALTINGSASWWAGGSVPMAAFVIAGGILIVRKIRRADMMLSFFAVFVASVIIGDPTGALSTLQKAAVHAPIFFFAFVMLTEPLTTPPTAFLRIAYGAIVGFLFNPAAHLGNVYFTPELALIVGNVFSYIVSPPKKYMLRLLRKEKVADGVYDFVFDAGEKMDFRPGQYMEWTLGHYKPDSRGNRRYFTLASSPTEKEPRIGVKFYDAPSTFKKEMMSLSEGDEMMSGQLAGDFTMPRDTKKKLAFLAGGIGVTPFRSMAKYLSDTNERRDITMLYCVKEQPEVAYKEVFDEAAAKTGMRTTYVITGGGKVSDGTDCVSGSLNDAMIAARIPDYKERIFYISGPHGMVDSMKSVLTGMGIKRNRIKTDFFPGFA